MYSVIGILVISKNRIESISLGDYLMMCFFWEICFFVVIEDNDEIDVFIWVSV